MPDEKELSSDSPADQPDTVDRFPELDELQQSVNRRLRDNQKFLQTFLDEEFDDEDEVEDEGE